MKYKLRLNIFTTNAIWLYCSFALIGSKQKQENTSLEKNHLQCNDLQHLQKQNIDLVSNKRTRCRTGRNEFHRTGTIMKQVCSGN